MGTQHTGVQRLLLRAAVPSSSSLCIFAAMSGPMTGKQHDAQIDAMHIPKTKQACRASHRSCRHPARATSGDSCRDLPHHSDSSLFGTPGGNGHRRVASNSEPLVQLQPLRGPPKDAGEIHCCQGGDSIAAQSAPLRGANKGFARAASKARPRRNIICSEDASIPQ